MLSIHRAPTIHVAVSLFLVVIISTIAAALPDDSSNQRSILLASKSGNPADSVQIRFKTATDEVPDFQKHVAPLLGRLGCNGRACHGSFQGQGGFRLSLFGYDFAADHQALVEAGAGRVDLSQPAASLLLTKPTSEDDHEGGLRYEKGSWQFNLLKSWIESGGQTADSIHKLDRLVVEPTEILIDDPGTSVELKATAIWEDGSQEDITPLCRFHSNDESIATINETGLVSTDTLAGDTHVVVSYDNAVVPIPVIHPFNSSTIEMGHTIESPTRIDELVARKWKQLNISPSELADDATFLRRVSIDIAGTLPAPVEIREFLDNPDPQKRRAKIDELLETPAYAAWWTTFFCDMTENNTLQLRNISYNNNLASQQWYDWIYQRVDSNVPYDEMVEGIVLGKSRQPDESYRAFCERMAETSSESNFPESDSMPYFWMRREFRDRETRAISFAHAFLGLRIQCAQCHKHPFDQWSQQDFKQFSNFFSGVTAQNYNQGRTPRDKQDYQNILQDLSIDPKQKNRGNIRKQLSQAYRQGKTTPFGYVSIHAPKLSREELKQYSDKLKQARKKDRKAKIPKPAIKQATLLGGQQITLAEFQDVRVPVMDWMRRSDNPFFAKALVNRVWAGYFGIGIVDPADDLNLANPPSNAPLLDYLAEEFIAHNFDLKWLHREITNSRTYQLSWVPNETNRQDARNFSRALPRRLPAEVVFDAVTSAASSTKTNSDYRNDVDGRAISIPGTTNYRSARKEPGTDASFALKVFGRSERASSCDCDRSDETSLIQTVYMQNDRDIHAMLTRKDSWVNQMAARHQAPANAKAIRNQMASLNKRLKSLKRSRNKLTKTDNQNQIQRVERQIQVVQRNVRQLKEKQSTAASSPEEMNVREVVTEAYLRTLSRFPTESELTRCESHIRQDKDLINGVTGVLWALVNTKEFIVNH